MKQKIGRFHPAVSNSTSGRSIGLVEGYEKGERRRNTETARKGLPPSRAEVPPNPRSREQSRSGPAAWAVRRT